MTRLSRWRCPAFAAVATLLATPGVAGAQTTAPAPLATAPAPPAPATPASAPGASQRIEITGGRAGDTEERRRSTAAKIVIGREEIERFGDSNTLEVLKRLPGVTVPGAPGRGGNPRMRGMAGGYTQILLDGERIPRGFALDSIPPEQIERIEILRAPTAETGARAIAGTINIVMREGFSRKVNDLNVGVQVEDGRASGGVNWNRNDTFGDWIVNSAVSLFRRHQHNDSTSLRQDTEDATGQTVLLRTGRSTGEDWRTGLNFNARIQWRDEQGSSLMLQPMLIASRGHSDSSGRLEQSLGSDLPDYARIDTRGDSRFTLARLNLNYNHRLLGSGPRLEWRAGIGEAHWRSDSRSLEFDPQAAPIRSIDDSSDSRDRSASVSLKATSVLAERHSLVSGLELEHRRRVDERVTLWDGVPLLTDFGDDQQSSSRRGAIYAQDEWSVTPRWALHAGLRWEGITTKGQGDNGVSSNNVSRVLTPLLHTVWKFDESSRDQLRVSLTRSYRSPDLAQLIGRPSLNRVDPPPGANTLLTPDSAGNPRLKPEVALGLDLAVERYLADGGVLSANLFHRRIADLIRNVVSLEDVSWSPGQPRYVSRPANIGNATSEGVELEAKFRLDQWIDDAPHTDIRANLSAFRSKVDGLPEPYNRLAEQPGGTLNLGADHRLRGAPLTLGANLNVTPGYRIQLDENRQSVQRRKNVLDAYALWAFNPDVKLRLSLSNLLVPTIAGETIAVANGVTQSNATTAPSFVNVQLRLELKL